MTEITKVEGDRVGVGHQQWPRNGANHMSSTKWGIPANFSTNCKRRNNYLFSMAVARRERRKLWWNSSAGHNQLRDGHMWSPFPYAWGQSTALVGKRRESNEPLPAIFHTCGNLLVELVSWIWAWCGVWSGISVRSRHPVGEIRTDQI